jgi:16S rRNA (cytosine967-C5)-methyltransferase
MIAPARTAALQALEAVATGSADLPSALEAARAALSDERDRALATEIASGTLRWQRRLDHLIAHVAGRTTADIDARVLTVLRLSAYQLLHLDRVPVAAVVDDAVDLARAANRARAAGFVNAVLRGLVRQRRRLPLPPRPPDSSDRQAALAYLGVSLSHPDWLVERWLDRYGLDDTERWLTFNNQRPGLTLRVNRRRATREALADRLAAEGVETAPTPWAPHGLTVRAGATNPGVSRGLAIVQDEASQLVSLTLDAQPGERVLDLCAAPGGKATALWSDLGDTGTLVACDVRPRRVRLLRDTLRESGATGVLLCRIATVGHLPFRAVFDRVLVDAPCSGLGTLRRDPDIKWRRTAADLDRLARDQRELLARAAQVVKPGGRLVNATCSSEPEENDEVVHAFLTAHPEFVRLDLREAGPRVLNGVIDAGGGLRTLPFAHGLEAFFAAALEKRGDHA